MGIAQLVAHEVGESILCIRAGTWLFPYYFAISCYYCRVKMDEDQLFELEYHDEMDMLAELENGKIFLR